MDYGFVRVAAAIPKLKVADCIFNMENMIELIYTAEKKSVQFVVFPELCITGYTCGDLFHQHALLAGAQSALKMLLEKTRDNKIIVFAGIPLQCDNQLFNCGVVIQSGRILGAVPKTFIPGYSEFYEEKWFAPGTKALGSDVLICGQKVPIGTDLLFKAVNKPGINFGLEICEDLWVPIAPSSYQALAGAVLLFNMSASNDIIGKNEYREQLVRLQSAKCIAGYVYTSCGIHESTTDVVFSGHSIIAEYGTKLAESERFNDGNQLVCADIDVQKLMNDRFKNTSFMEANPDRKYRTIEYELYDNDDNSDYYVEGSFTRKIDPHPFVPSDPGARDKRCSEIFAIQTAGLRKRLEHTGFKNAVIGISGGLDSTLALLVTARTFDSLGIPRKGIVAFTMPGFGTTGETYNNAKNLMKFMGVTINEVDIKPSCLLHFKDIGHDADIHDVTYENVQARERTQILMDTATKIHGLVIGTGDLSELALGWSTYNGDHMSMYSVNCSIPKTLVKYLVKWVADNVVDKNTRDVLIRILDTPISPELLPPDANGRINQKTEDIVGPYELHDFFLYHMVRYGAPPKKILFLACKAFNGTYREETIRKWLIMYYKRFFSQQFKRSCLPDGPKVGTISLSPRGDWRMPSDAEAKVWLSELDI